MYDPDNRFLTFYCGTPNYMPPEIAFKNFLLKAKMIKICINVLKEENSLWLVILRIILKQLF